MQAYPRLGVDATVHTPDGIELSLVIPMYNERELAEDSVAANLEACRALVAAQLIATYEIVTVDDGSDDGTAAILHNLAATDPHVRTVPHPRNRGLGAAVRTGLAQARGRLLLYTDADLPCDLITAMPPALDLLAGDNVGLVAGYRTSRGGEGLHRNVYSMAWNQLTRATLGVRVRDINFAFKLLRREAYERFVLTAEGSFIDAEIVAETKRCGYDIAQLGLEYRARTRGTSTLSSASVITAMTRDLLRARSTYRRPAGARKSRKQSPLVVINADDCGLTRNVSAGIIRGHLEGIITSTSILANAPAFDVAAQMLRDTPTLDVGVHLAVVGEDPPLLSAKEIPTLVCAGEFHPNWKSLVAALVRGRVDPEDLRREFNAQIDAVKSAGLAMSHLNTHQHVHLWPTIAPIVVSLAVERGIDTIRVPRHSPVLGTPVNLLAETLRRKVRHAGLTAPHYLAGMAEAGDMTLSVLRRALLDAATSEADVVEISCHPGDDVDPDRGRYAWDYHWSHELEALCDPSLRSLAGDLGLRLGGFRDRAMA